jgi:hypothetical protein
MGFAVYELQELSKGLKYRVPIISEAGKYYGELDYMQLVVPGDTIEVVKARLAESILDLILLRAEDSEPFQWPQDPPSVPTAVEVATIFIRYRPSASSDDTTASASPA